MQGYTLRINLHSFICMQMLMHVVKATVSSRAPKLLVLTAMCVPASLATDLMIMGTHAMVGRVVPLLSAYH